MTRTAQGLGYAGLIPFVALSLGMNLHPLTTVAFTTYSAVILSFLGGIHWGVALTRPEWSTPTRIGLCMLPSLLGWLALLLPTQGALIVLMISYLSWWLWDRSQLDQPDYRRLRFHLTAVVVLCHLVWLVQT
ncbi:DUF3429 domain-containing protein [Marinobacterium sediminicola]|uniref:DUF3429 domain-containing protein n=1 Tax=Marinobacterium sediminicola TaxID=518898 RepID=A0ABY1S335_9GAMM|nr:DUF3429 domain-containing protein [Marinobacterium sediminicola]ULG68156.1 DUF3429 domain-containing protein [Marinobacterium sediminicola]SMR77681.1 Protein of unknown function [Marinobacterium sediminicola]